MKKLSGLPLIATLALVGCGVTERHHATFQKTWQAEQIRIVRVEDANGSLRVTGGAPGSAITLRASVRSSGPRLRKGEPQEEYFRTSVDGDTLAIGARRRKVTARFPFFNGRSTSVDYDLEVPPSMALKLRMVNGNVAVRGVSGETEVVTVNGRIDIESAGTSGLLARTVNGRVRAVFLTDFTGASLKTVNGSVEAVLPRDASFTCSLSQVNGDFEAASAFPLRIHSHPGSRRVSGEVNGGRHELKITTVNGDVEVHQIAAASPLLH